MTSRELDSSVLRALESAYLRVHQWGVFLGSIVLVCYLIVTHVLHLVKQEFHLEIALFGLIFLLGEQVRGIARLQRQLSHKVDDLQSELPGVLRGKLLSLTDCVREIKERLTHHVRPMDKVVIHHVGLNMNIAWEQIRDALRGLNNVKTIEYHLLMLGPQGAHENEEVKKWRLDAIDMYAEIKAQLPGIARDLSAKGITLAHSLHTYSTSPHVHGIQIVSPPAAKAAYIAFCRWSGPETTEFQWGRDEYHEILGEPLTPSLIDIRDVFEGFFSHQVKTSSP